MNIAELKALAEKATPGPWTYSPMTETEDPEIGAANGSRVAALVCADMTKQNSAYIAAANPAAVLELIAKHYEMLAIWEPVDEAVRGRADISVGDSVSAKALTLIAQRDELRAALKLYEQAFEGMFAQCCSNGMTDAWGKPIDCTLLNEAHSAAGTAIAKCEVIS